MVFLTTFFSVLALEALVFGILITVDEIMKQIRSRRVKENAEEGFFLTKAAVDKLPRQFASLKSKLRMEKMTGVFVTYKPGREYTYLYTCTNDKLSDEIEDDCVYFENNDVTNGKMKACKYYV